MQPSQSTTKPPLQAPLLPSDLNEVGVDIKANDKVMHFLVPHAGATLNRAHVGADGRTGFERERGKPFRGEVMEFGEACHYRLNEDRFKMEARWSDGVWFGRDDESSEHIILDKDGWI